MPDPITLTLVGTVVLKEGIKFLYGQAGDLIKRWREQRDGKAAETAKSAETQKELPAIFEGSLGPLVEDRDRLKSLEGELLKLRSAVSNYVDGTEPVDASDNKLTTLVDALRQALETIYGQRITFKGEQREPSGAPLIIGEADVKRVMGLAAGVVADTVTEGEIRGKLKSDEVAKDGVAAGVRVRQVGRDPKK